MKTRLIAIATLTTLAATATWAADTASLTRAEVGAAVLAARANGQLMGPGEAIESHPVAPISIRSRADVEREVAAAQKNHTLMAVGDLSAPDVVVRGMGRSRAEVKAETVAARIDGGLLGAGEGLAREHAATKAPRGSVAGLR
jgi:hypothetical protein